MSEKLSEIQIIEAARKSKPVLEALMGLLETMEDKTGYESQAITIKGRVDVLDQQEQEGKAALNNLLQQIKDAETSLTSVRDKAKSIIDDANTQANNTKILAQNEAGLIMQRAQEDLEKFKVDSSAQCSVLERAIVAKRNELDDLEKAVKAKGDELESINGDLAAAKDEIRRKFLNN